MSSTLQDWDMIISEYHYSCLQEPEKKTLMISYKINLVSDLLTQKRSINYLLQVIK